MLVAEGKVGNLTTLVVTRLSQIRLFGCHKSNDLATGKLGISMWVNLCSQVCHGLLSTFWFPTVFQFATIAN